MVICVVLWCVVVVVVVVVLFKGYQGFRREM